MIRNFLSKVEYLVFFSFNIVYQFVPAHSIIWQIFNFFKVYKIYIKNWQSTFSIKDKNSNFNI